MTRVDRLGRIRGRRVSRDRHADPCGLSAVDLELLVIFHVHFFERAPRRSGVLLAPLLGAGLACALAVPACFDADLVRNNVAFRGGNVNFIFVNDTPYRASFTFGMYDALDKSQGAVLTQQIRVEGNSTTSPTQLGCRRNAVIGGSELIRRSVENDFEDDAAFDLDAFSEVVNFSSAPADSESAALPTQGTSLGRNVLLGVDFDCGDRLIFTFVESPDSPGGFRIDFAAVPIDDDDL